MVDLTLISYLFYGLIALAANIAVGSYLVQRWDDMEWPTRTFTICAALNFASDGLSKAWFGLWRMLGKPPGMVDHFIVDAVTFSAAFAVAGAFWFWTRRRTGDLTPLGIAAGALAAAIGIPALF